MLIVEAQKIRSYLDHYCKAEAFPILTPKLSDSEGVRLLLARRELYRADDGLVEGYQSRALTPKIERRLRNLLGFREALAAFGLPTPKMDKKINKRLMRVSTHALVWRFDRQESTDGCLAKGVAVLDNDVMGTMDVLLTGQRAWRLADGRVQSGWEDTGKVEDRLEYALAHATLSPFPYRDYLNDRGFPQVHRSIGGDYDRLLWGHDLNLAVARVLSV